MFIPDRIIFEKNSSQTPMGQRIIKQFKDDTRVAFVPIENNRIKEHIPGDGLFEQYRYGKKTLVVGVKKGLKFQSCKPSAHYQLPLVSGCMGQCEYCYLNTKLGDKPFIKVHTNQDEILQKALVHIGERKPEITIFEGAATSDPLPVEPYTHSLANAITFFGQQEFGRFRFVTKYADVESLLELSHNGHTEIRFSINTDTVIQNYEHATASRKKRIGAAKKVAEAGYPMGVLIAPVFLYEGWKEEYLGLLMELKEALSMELQHPLTFEVITHRYTMVAKNRICEIYPDTKLPMNEEERKFKYGQFGYGKYIYPKEQMEEVKEFFTEKITQMFPLGKILYII